MDQQPVPQSSAAPLTTSSIQQSNSKNSLLWIVPLIISLIVLGTAGYFVTKNYFAPAPTTSIPNLNTETSLELPLNPNSPDIIAYGYYYVIEGQITNIEKTEQGLRVSTDASSLQDLLVDDRTLIHYFINNQSYQQTATSDLQIGQKIRISLTYDNRREQVITKGVLILVENAPNQTSTESAQLQN